jgi:hypothetical protein
MNDNWAGNEFERTAFHDGRVRKSIVKAAEAVARKQGASHSAAVGDGLRQATGDAFGAERNSPDSLLEGHKPATLDRCMEHGTVLALHDSTSFNYSSHLAAVGLGPLNDNGAARGIRSHGSFAVSTGGLPLGLLSVFLWARGEPGPVKLTGAQKAALPIEDKESYKWLRSAEQTTKCLLPFLESGGEAFLTGDRESDIIEFVAQPRHRNLHLLIRARHLRNVTTEAGASRMPALLAAASEGGDYPLAVSRQRGRPARQATMSVKFVKATLAAPKNKSVDDQVVWIVQASEKDAPEGAEPLSQTLLTTKEIVDFDQARTIVGYYAKRWIIETLHFTLKTGCLNVERLQFDDYHTLANALAFYYVVAWQVLRLMHWSREHPDEPADRHLAQDELALLRRTSKKPVQTMRQAMTAVARLGGYVYYPKAGPPGVKLLCAGQSRLNDMVTAIRLMKEPEKL